MGPSGDTEQHFAVRYTSRSGTHLVDYETREREARHAARPGREAEWLRTELLTRTVTFEAWHPA